ncbi:uncharacterized protein [Salminus brasiliensis]|uniref:uncharacterized protein n=1 Tax=Salminus brasiliensis TaxID=930266 RepID=UPI003B830BD7
MEVSTLFLLLLVACGVSAVQKERHFFHIHTVHFSPFQTTSTHTELPAAVQPDGESLVSWRSRTRVEGEELTDLHDVEVSIRLLEIRYNGTDHIDRKVCETERSSRGAVTVLDSTADHRNTILLIFTPTDDAIQCVVLDTDFLLDEGGSPNLSPISRGYLVQSCMERLVTGLYDEKDSRTALAAGSGDDLISAFADWLVSYLHRVMLIGIAVWGIYRQDMIILQGIFVWVFFYLGRSVVFFSALWGILAEELVIVQVFVVWGICNQDISILTVASFHGLYNQKLTNLPGRPVLSDGKQSLIILPCFFALVFSYVDRHCLYCFALLAIFKQDMIMLRSFAIWAIYNEDIIILTGIAYLVIYYLDRKLRFPYVEFSGNTLAQYFSLSYVFAEIIFHIKRKFKKRKSAKSPVNELHRDLNALMDDKQGGGHSDQTETDDDDDDDDGQNRLAHTGSRLNQAARRFTASMDTPLTLAGDDGKNRLAAGLSPAGGRFTASMDTPLTLAGDDGRNRLAAGLSPAGGRFTASMDTPLTLGGWNPRNVSTPNLALERTEASDQ